MKEVSADAVSVTGRATPEPPANLPLIGNMRFFPARRALVTALLALAVLPAAAPAAQRGIAVLGYSPGNTVDEAATAGQLLGQNSGGWVRIFVDWAPIEPADESFDESQLQQYDRRIDALRAQGLNIVMVAQRAPGWARLVPGSTVSPPADPNQYARFMAVLADRYAGKVGAWELWNEPDDKVHWYNGPEPARYAALLKATYPAVKAAARARGADPVVLVGGLVGNDYDFVEQLYRNGAGDSFDAVGVHTDTACLVRNPGFYYREESGRIGRYAFSGYREVRQTMLNHGQAKDIWMTELGWAVDTSDCPAEYGAEEGRKSGVTAAQQAEFLKQAYQCVATDPYLRVGIWFSMQDASSAGGFVNRYGLIDYNGAPRPSFAAFQQAGGLGPAFCGAKVDVDKPAMTMNAPKEYFDRLALTGSATDPTTPISRIELWVDGKRVQGANKDGSKYEIDWFGARELSYGNHDVELRAYDEALNVGVAKAVVKRVNRKNASRTLNARIAFRVKKTGGRKLKIVGRVRKALDGGSEEPRGRLRIFVERFKKGKFRPFSRYTKGISRTARINYTARKGGRFRVWARYAAEAPYKHQRTKKLVFRLR